MKLKVNGNEMEVKDEITVSALLEQLKLNASYTVVEINGRILSKAGYSATVLEDGDKIELIRFVGGG